jgi:hypothetical protein
MADLIGTVRRNHGLEHATISVMLRRLGRDIRTVGRATRDGFFLYADVPAELVEECADEALRRMKAGEGHLAVSPFCGTNIAVAGALTAGASLLAIGRSARADRLPNAMLASMLAIVIAQPLGRLLQKHITTSPDLADTEIVGVRPGGRGGARFFKVQTARRPSAA